MTGQVLGVGIAGAILQAVLSEQLKRRITGDGALQVRYSSWIHLRFDTDRISLFYQIIESIRQSSSSIRDLEEPFKSAAIASYDQAIHAVFIFCAAFALLTVISGACVREIDTTDGAGKQAVNEDEL